MKLKRTLALLYLLFFIFSCLAQPPKYLTPKFQNLTLKNGLTNLQVNAICQDEVGYIWIGTARGLNRFDGTSFKHYFFKSDSSSLYHSDVMQLHKASNGEIFCATRSGVNLYNPKTDRLKRVISDEIGCFAFAEHKKVNYVSHLNGGISYYDTPSNSLIPVYEFPKKIILYTLISDDKTGLWGKTHDNKFLYNYDPKTKIYDQFIIPGNNNIVGGNGMTKFGHYLIISSFSKICLFDLNKKAFVDIPPQLNRLKSVNADEIFFISQIEEGVLWIGTKGSGLYIYYAETNKLINYTNSNQHLGLSSNNLTCICTDMNKNVWIGTFDHGVEISFEKRKNFNFDSKLNEIIQKNFINSITSDKKGNYYFGSRLKGVFVYHSKSKTFEQLNSKNSFLKDDHIRYLKLDSRNKLWIGTEEYLYLYDLNTKKVTELDIPKPHKGIVYLCESDNKMLAGTDSQGMLVYNKQGELEKHVTQMGPNITQILKTGTSKFIVSSYGMGRGLYEYYINNDSTKKINNRLRIPKEKLSEIITCYYDSDSILWVGNFKYGLYRIDIPNDSIMVFNDENGLPSTDITGIIEDSEGNLWLSTAYGLSQFDKKSKFINYFYNEGLTNIQFHQKAVHRDNMNTIFFGGNFGLTYFNPSNTKKLHEESPRIILTSLLLSNKKVNPNDDTNILKKALYYTPEITLTHKHPSFGINYHGFDYMAANNIKYAYILEGYNKGWNIVGDRTFANFSNLSPGRYTFKVKAQNNYGVWSDPPAQLKINIKAAPWKTPLAYFIYTIIFALTIYLSFKLTLQAKIYRTKLAFEHRERLREKEVTQMKMRFFTNISHELRTPLTLIKGNVDYLTQEHLNKQTKDSALNNLKTSTDRLLRLVNQLLSFRKLENDALDLEIREGNIVRISEDIIETFKYAASTKGITLNLKCTVEKHVVPMDQDKYEKILNNLIGNALKFSPTGESIQILISDPDKSIFSTKYPSLNSQENYIEISVIDHGKGIPNKDLPLIFHRYKQSKIKEEIKPDYSGTGIGLNFTQRLVELHKGAISVSSKENVETTFSLVLPISKNSYPPESCITSSNKEIEINFPLKKKTDIEEISEKKRVLLLVEDDLELNNFIKEALSDSYKIITTFNGLEGLKLAKNHLPDLIISDIMMPEMDGITLCNRIRNDELISHIPVMLLTAKTDDESKITGYEFGADDYVTKPFELNVLKARISNLIQLRKRLQKGYQMATPIIAMKEEPSNQFELNFMKKIDAIIQENYADPELNVQNLAKKMNMSRTNFYRKFMNIADISPKEYLTKFRINKSIELMQHGNEDMGEISHLCGFSSHSIFSTSFKKEKEVTPSQFKKSLN